MTSQSKVISPSPKYFNPIPTKPSSSLNSRYNCYPVSISPSNLITTVSTNNTVNTFNTSVTTSTPPPLDDLINDCFLYSIDQLRDSSKVEHVKKFQQFVSKLHCEENLKFLIEIYKYEYYYDRIFPLATKIQRLNSTPSPNLSCYLNNQSIDSCIGHSLPGRRRAYSKNIPSAANSIRSEELDPNAVFVSTIDDLDPENLTELNNNTWDNLKLKNIGLDLDEDDEDEDELEDVIDESEITEVDRQLLNSQWDQIISNYINYDAPEQINLSQKLYDQILKESETNTLHKPPVLLCAKNEVLQLIRENAYMSYLSRERTNCSRCETTSTTVPTSPTSLNGDIAPPSDKDVVPRSITIDSGFSTHSGSTSPTAYMNQSYKQMKTKILSLSSSVSNSGSHSTTHSSSTSHTATPQWSEANSPSHNSSSSSIANIFGHLKLHNNSNNSNNSHHSHHHSHSHHHNNLQRFGTQHCTSTTHSGASTPIASALHSLNTSPISQIENTSSNGASSLKFWSKKKN
ncbi:uncharacterized protein RJT20DRAFT_132324 [Scheffersomyces xylosifermentans]|uniref:uncharacterized protein n=1 Tax=Scheffersomyces xylosifermentans TaxID=1304137 RepID=UPI00315D6AB3